MKDKEALTAAEQRLLEILRGLNREGQEKIFDYAETLDCLGRYRANAIHLDRARKVR